MDRLAPIRKAVIALVIPWALAALAALADRVGLPAPDPTVIETLVASIVTAVFVWLVPNSE